MRSGERSDSAPSAGKECHRETNGNGGVHFEFRNGELVSESVIKKTWRRRGIPEDRTSTFQIIFLAIAGVRLPDQNGAGHFIAVLEQQGEDYVIGDPLVGKLKMTVKQLQAEYYFTGFFMLMK